MGLRLTVRAVLRWLFSSTGLALIAGGVLAVVGAWQSLVALSGIGIGIVIIAIAVLATNISAALGRGLEHEAGARHQLVGQLRAAESELERMTSALRQAGEVRAEVEVLEQRAAELSAELAGVSAHFSTSFRELEEALRKLREDEEHSTRDLGGRLETTQTSIAELKTDLVEERSNRNLLAMRLTDPEVPIRRVLLQMTVHRSGSTRFLDVMRTHPAVRMAPTMSVWNELGLRGRRYPVAFSDTSDAWVPIEVEFGVGSTVPKIPVALLPGPPPEQQWCVEKAHPQFADSDLVGLANRIEALRAGGVEVEVVYGIRRPLDAMWSMANFKARQPSWYRSLGIGDIPAWILKSLQDTEDLLHIVDGPVVDYEDFPNGKIFREIGQRLNPEWTSDQVETWIAFAEANITARKRTQRADSGFLGEGDSERLPDGPDGAWQSHGEMIAEADEIYHRLRTARGGRLLRGAE